MGVFTVVWIFSVAATLFIARKRKCNVVMWTVIAFFVPIVPPIILFFWQKEKQRQKKRETGPGGIAVRLILWATTSGSISSTNLGIG